MALEDDALAFVRGLDAPWRTLFRNVANLDLGSPNLGNDLRQTRPIDRTQPGFSDFDPVSSAAIVPGDPAASLLYHALASPLVKPPGAAVYPTMVQLDLIENYILSLLPMEPGAIPGDAVVAAFAYEYRCAPATTHRLRADFVYSRMGCSRIGEAPAAWDGPNRCWLNATPGARAFSVMPARFAAFLAVPRQRSPDGISVLDGLQDGDEERIFLLPIRKLFDGPGCIAGHDLGVSFTEFHRREKLRRIFTESDLEKPPGLDKPPFLRDSTNGGPLVQMDQAGASVVVSSIPEPLVRLARLPDGGVASFKVPPERDLPIVDFSINRNNGARSTFQIITGGLVKAGLEAFLQTFADVHLRPRNAPEFVNMRHKLTDDPANPVVDLTQSLNPADYDSALAEGGYRAALFEDNIADGCILPVVNGAPGHYPTIPAFSVIGAPKFFPYADEIDIEDWVNEFPSHNRKDQFKKGGPKPLHLGRLPPNLTLYRPGSGSPAFGPSDETAVAIVGRPYVTLKGPTRAKSAPQDMRPEHRWTTFLSDGCSGVFAPGWDVTFAEENGHQFYATFGLGSPFPEDVKLCAAANAFWPAASPDAARTFNRGPTAIPMLDSELGFHHDNPRRNMPAPTFGWDGEQGPFIAGQAVNFANFVRSDYVSHVFEDHSFSGSPLRDVTSRELIARMDALRLCIQALPESSAEVSHTKLWLVHAEHLPQPPVPVHANLGPCYRYELVVPSGPVAPSAEPNRLLQPWVRRYVCYVSDQGLSWARDEAGPYTFVPGS
ncbi:MAG TPA: hypothetical protein VGM96_04655 [Reyranella sp.]|jgi:hypothetical protein